MLRCLSSILGYKVGVGATSFGHVKDFYFDDRGWTVRYLLIKPLRRYGLDKLLLSPSSLGELKDADKVVPAIVPVEKMLSAPKQEEELTVSRQYEIALSEHYGWPFYWDGKLTSTTPLVTLPDEVVLPEGDPNLRSAVEVMGYTVQANDDTVGHIDDFVVSTETWCVESVVVDTRDWLPDRKVTLSHRKVERIDWQSGTIFIPSKTEDVEKLAAFDERAPVNRKVEVRFYDYCGRPVSA